MIITLPPNVLNTHKSMKTFMSILLGIAYFPLWLIGAVLVAVTRILMILIKFPRALGLLLTGEKRMATDLLTKFLFK